MHEITDLVTNPLNKIFSGNKTFYTSYTLQAFISCLQTTIKSPMECLLDSQAIRMRGLKTQADYRNTFHCGEITFSLVVNQKVHSSLYQVG